MTFAGASGTTKKNFDKPPAACYTAGCRIVRIRTKTQADGMATGHTIAMALRAAYLAMHRQADVSLLPGGVTADQFVLLAALSESDSSTQQELARRTSCDPNTLRAMLLLLEAKGLIRRDPDPTDGRARRVVLTEHGWQQFEALRASSEPFRRRL